MVITVEDIVKDVVSNFPASAENFDYRKVFEFINQSYIKIRDEYIRNNRETEFAISQTITSFSASDFPYFNQATLDRTILRNVALDNAIISTVVRTAPELTDPNFTDKIFEPEDVRNYHPGNGIQYFEGDVVYEKGRAFKANQDVVATSTDDLENQAEWTEVYFMQIGPGYSNAEIIGYHLEDRHKVIIDSGVPVITVVLNTVYVSKDIKKLEIEYIPEHEKITDFDDTLVMPDSAIKTIRDMVVAEMVQTIPNTGQTNDE